MRVRWFSIFALVALLAVGLSACGDKKKKKDTGGGTASTATTGGGGGGKSLTIYSSLPLQGASGPQSKAINDGAKLALKERGGKVGDLKITFKPLDDSVASTGAADDAQTQKNAQTAASDPTTIGYIGEYNSGATKVSLPVLNTAGVPQVSPSNTNPGLTTNKPGSQPGEPDKFYPSGKRTYARVVPIDTIQGAALATTAKNDGCKGVTTWNTKTPYSEGLATNVELAAKKIGLQFGGNTGIDIKAPNYRSLANGVKTDCFIFTGEIESNGVQAIKDVAAAKPSVKLYGGDGVISNALADPKTGLPAAVGARFKGTIATLDPKFFPASGKKFFADFKKEYHTQNPDPYGIYGFESMDLLLDSIEAAGAGGNDKAKVAEQLFKQKDRDSVLGKYSIDENGDTTLTDYGLYGIKGGKLTFLEVIKAQGGA